MAVPQASLVYVNASNNEVQVRSCEPSEEIAAVPLISVTDGCSIRHDFAAGRSYQTGRHIYELNGTTWQADACSDNGTEYPHETVYKSAAGQEVCAPIINQVAGTVTRQSRKQIVVNGVEQFITECKPDSTNIAIQSTIDGCDNPSLWNHDLAAGTSYGRERFYYLLDGSREYISQCQDSEVAYPHQVETAGWQHHDDQLFSYRLTTVYIEGTPKGRYSIVTSQVLDGAVQMPYIYEEQAIETTGEFEHEGCTKFAKTATVEKYQRPDGTAYKLQLAEAEPVNQGDDCTAEITWDDANASFQKGYSQGLIKYEPGNVHIGYTCYARTYTNATKKIIRNSDGALIQTLGPKAGMAQKSTSGDFYQSSSEGDVAERNAKAKCQPWLNGTNPYNPIPGSIKGDLEDDWGW